MTHQPEIALRVATVGDSRIVHDIIVEAFAAGDLVAPISEALSEHLADVTSRIESETCLIASVASEDVGCIFLADGRLRRLSVVPGYRGMGVARTLVAAAADLAIERGSRTLDLWLRRESDVDLDWWNDHGFEPQIADDHHYCMVASLPVRTRVATAEDMRRLGERLAGLLQAGDLIVATGELGAGKTTLTQGLGQGMGVAGPVTSPTFVLTRIHPADNGPGLIHVDAYRLASADELDDIDVDETMAANVTLIEWGEGKAEHLSHDRLEILIARSGDPSDDTRTVDFLGVGERWAGVDISTIFEESAS